MTLFQVTSARKFVETAKAVKNTKRLRSPKVETTQFEFELKEHYYYVDMTPPTVKLGWEVDQVFDT